MPRYNRPPVRDVKGKSRRSRLSGSRALLLASIGALAFLAKASADDVPADARAFLKGWAEKMRGVRSLRVEFDQTKELRILRKPLVSHGVALLKGKRLLLVVTGKDGERETELQVDVEKGEARIHYPKLKRLEVVELGKGGAPASAPFPIFGGDVEALPETYSVRLEKAGPSDDEAVRDKDVLVLVPRETRAGETKGEMRMVFARNFEISEVRQVDAKGNRVRVAIRKFQVNPELDDSSVALDVPEGTKVVRLFGRPSDSPGTAPVTTETR